jgi:inosine-uridine nucleoside N-ribohydrolase
MKLVLIGALMAVLGSGQPEKVVFDTDCAYFNDDGAALVMLLNSPRQVAIQGISIVPGNFWPVPGAELMSHILKLIHRPDVPIYFGAQAPLLHTPAMVKKEAGIEYLGAFATDEPKYSGPLKAIDFLIETLEKSPGKVTVLALGPMTNLAIALRLRPDLASKIGRLVFMGGALHKKEFNFWFDPEAAQIVLRSSIAKKTMFGLDICDHAPIDKAHSDQITARTPIGDLYREDRKKNPALYVWDTLPAAFLIDSKFVTKRETDYLDVDTVFGKNYGAVIPLDRTLAPDATPVEVMMDLDFERFFALYKSLIH